MKEESYIDWLVRRRRADFDRSPLRKILDNLGIKKGNYSIGGDSGYRTLRLLEPDMEIRLHDNGKIYVYSAYDPSVGAWGSYTRCYEVVDADVFKSSNWESIIKSGSVPTSPDVVMI